MDTFELLDIWSYPYAEDVVEASTADFIIQDSYVPMLTPSYTNTQVYSLLPAEDESITFTIEDGILFFDPVYNGYLANITQTGNTINAQMTSSYVGNHVQLSRRQDNMILDGGYISIQPNGDINISGGLAILSSEVKGFAGLQLNLSNEITPLSSGRGFCVSVFMSTLSQNAVSDLIIPEVVKTDLIDTQIGDYSTLYAVIQQNHSINYDSMHYIEICRLQIVSQSPSTPYISMRLDQRMRQPPIDCYPI